MGNEVSKSNIFDAIGEKLSSFLDIQDSVMDNDYVGLLGDASKLVGFITKASKLATQKQFEKFLKTFQAGCNTEEQLLKLMAYIDSEQKAEFIANTMQKILLSKSSKSCLIMGAIMQDITNNKADLTLEDLVCLDALTNFFDFDFENYKYICKPIYKNKKKHFDLYWQWQNKCKEDGFRVSSVTLTVEKAVSYQLLSKDTDVQLDIDSDDVGSSGAESDISYSMTAPGEKLYEYILSVSESGLF